MRKALHIIIFIAILGFLLYLVPPINQYLKSSTLEVTTRTSSDLKYIATPTTDDTNFSKSTLISDDSTSITTTPITTSTKDTLTTTSAPTATTTTSTPTATTTTSTPTTTTTTSAPTTTTTTSAPIATTTTSTPTATTTTSPPPSNSCEPATILPENQEAAEAGYGGYNTSCTASCQCFYPLFDQFYQEQINGAGWNVPGTVIGSKFICWGPGTGGLAYAYSRKACDGRCTTGGQLESCPNGCDAFSTSGSPCVSTPTTTTPTTTTPTTTTPTTTTPTTTTPTTTTPTTTTPTTTTPTTTTTTSTPTTTTTTSAPIATTTTSTPTTTTTTPTTTTPTPTSTPTTTTSTPTTTTTTATPTTTWTDLTSTTTTSAPSTTTSTPTTTIGSTFTSTTTSCPPPETIIETVVQECPETVITECPEVPTCPIDDPITSTPPDTDLLFYCGDGIIRAPEQCELPNTPGCDANCKIIPIGSVCQEDPSKDFDYGALATANPPLNLAFDTEEATHFVSDDEFPSIWIGDGVDAPEGMANDASAKDQDGLNMSQSNNNQAVLNKIYNIRNNYGTIIVGRWEKKGAFFEFKVLAAVQMSKAVIAQTPSIVQADGSLIIPFDVRDPLTGLIPDMHDGWLTILYFDAEGSVTPGVPGSNQTAINGMPNFGFTLDQIKGTFSTPQWDGRNPTLDQIIYGGARKPFDVSRAPGEVEDYLYCDKGPTGFRFYKPGDPQYALDCGAIVILPPEVDVCVNTPETTIPTLNVVCNFNNVQSFICNQNEQAVAGAYDTATDLNAPIDNRPVATIIEDLLNQYQNGPNRNTPEGRLRIIHAYLRTLLPTL